MKLLITLSESDPDAWLSVSEEEQERVYAQHRAFDAAVAERGTLIEGAALSSITDTRTLHLTGGERTVTEGPYAEAAEQLTGVYLVDLPDMDAAIEVCRLLPEGYVIGIRPTIVLDDY